MSMNPEPIWQPAWCAAAPCVYLRQELVLAEGVSEAWVECGCPGAYQVYLNGELAGRGVGTSLWPTPMWERFDLTQQALPGPSMLLVVAGRPLTPVADAWFVARGRVVYASGARVELGTSAAWQVLNADAWQPGDGESLSCVYLAPNQDQAWTNGRFRPEAWGPAAVVTAAPPGEWEPRPAAEREVWPHEVTEFGEIPAGGPLRFESAPGAMQQSKCVHREGLLESGKSWTLVQARNAERAVYLVLDFGRVVRGFPRLRLRGRPGVLVDVGFARRRGCVDAGLRYVSGSGLQEWTDLCLRTCRYLVLRLSACPEGVEVDALSFVERRVDLLETGRFTGPEGLERIWEAGQLNLDEIRQEVYYLAPGRATTDWLSAYPLSLEEYYLSGDLRTAAATLASGRAPEDDLLQLFAYLLFLDAYHLYSGDRALATALLPPALRALDQALPRQVTGEGLSAAGGRWSATAANAFGAGALKAATRLCRSLRQRDSASRCDQAARQLEQALQQAWSPGLGLFAEAPGQEQAGQWANALTLFFGLASDGQAQIAARLRSQARPSVGLWEAFFLVAGLGQAGQAHRALGSVEQYWGRLAGHPGRSWGEKAGLPGVEALPGPGYFLGAQLLGIRPAAPGYRVLEVHPQPAGLHTVGGRVWSRRGSVEVDWSRAEDGERYALELVLAEPGPTRLAVPRLGRRFPTLTLNDETLWRNEKFYPNSFVRKVVAGAEEIVLELEDSGRFEVVVE